MGGGEEKKKEEKKKEEEKKGERCNTYKYEDKNLGYSLFLCPKHIMCMCGINTQ